MAGRFDRDVLFAALQRLGKTENEAEDILMAIDSKGFCNFGMGLLVAQELKRQFHNQHELYSVSTFGGDHAGGWVNVHVSSRCVQPDAPWASCICGTPVKTCERKTPKEIPGGSDYRCPVHSEGAQLPNGKWVCSPECWEVAAEQK